MARIYSLLIIIFITFLYACKGELKETELSTLQERNGLYYEVNTETPFTGIGFSKYDTEQYKLKVRFKKGQFHGKREQYSENGQLVASQEFKKGNPIGTFQYYREDGTLEIKGKTSETGQKKTQYYSNGNKMSETSIAAKMEFVDGRVSIDTDSADAIKETTWFENGAKQTQTSMKKGKGFQKEFYENGELAFESYYQNYQPHGKHVYYHQNGSISSFKTYVNGKKDGVTFDLNENGDTTSVISYDKGMLHGMHQTYFSNGTLNEVKMYRGGMLYGNYQLFYESGKPKIICKYAHDVIEEGSFQAFNADGTKRPDLQTTLQGTWLDATCASNCRHFFTISGRNWNRKKYSGISSGFWEALNQDFVVKFSHVLFAKVRPDKVNSTDTFTIRHLTANRMELVYEAGPWYKEGQSYVFVKR